MSGCREAAWCGGGVVEAGGCGGAPHGDLAHGQWPPCHLNTDWAVFSYRDSIELAEVAAGQLAGQGLLPYDWLGRAAVHSGG